ncbi:agmatine coumaroyltransferase-2-like [Typha angustifolia]|uniref:agmatine coumaroyltransferase-2-like n=1 Tax=Typha angustifolia TaxID=59011 RepID=UPI003C2FACFA
MEVKIESSRLLKPAYEGIDDPPSGTASEIVKLSLFDKVTDDAHFAAICAFRAPNPPNSVWENSLAKVLTTFREWAGRLGEDADGNPAIILNDEGVRFVEASVDAIHDDVITSEPSPALLGLHPSPWGVEELAQVQLTRFACGTLVVGFTFHHKLGDGYGTTHFLVSWASACRGVDIGAGPMHDRTSFFAPRDPPQIEFEHRMAEYRPKGTRFLSGYKPTEETVVHRVHFTKEFIAKLKAKVSSRANTRYSTFESLMAHLWRTVTMARGVEAGETTRLRIAVNGRHRMDPEVPEEYFGNLVLWAYCSSKVGELVNSPLHYAAEVIHSQVTRLNDRYFRSFIDFASSKVVDEEDLVPLTDPDAEALYPDVDVNSWLGFPMRFMDFGGGKPFYFIPSYFPMEGLLFVVPSFFGEDGSVDAYVPLFESKLPTFQNICYSLEDKIEMETYGNSCSLDKPVAALMAGTS